MGEKGKKVLILGNGFDLAHGLPTKYIDFLKCCKLVEGIYEDASHPLRYYERRLDVGDVRQEIVEALRRTDSTKDVVNVTMQCGNNVTFVKGIDDAYITEIHHCLQYNVWYEYFGVINHKKMMNGENWIDFESEIRYIIQSIDEKATNLSLTCGELFRLFRKDKMQDSQKNTIFMKCLLVHFTTFDLLHNTYIKFGDTVNVLRERCFKDLERLIRALELYCAYFVERIPVERKIKEISEIRPDYVINFNYTNTYERVYDFEHVFHIHGNCDCDRDASENNMVLGIDEYWSEQQRDKHTNFTVFKKFSQRISKKTGIENYKYINEIKNIYEANKNVSFDGSDKGETDSNGVSFVYIFGHSLDVTDKDILKDFLGSEATVVTVYCKDKGTEGELIANIIQIIGEKRLLEKVNQIPSKLRFVTLKDVGEGG